MVLEFLTPKDKKNLKLASKACERRVMANDPAMRKWKIIVEHGGKCFEEIILPLAKAKLRHVEDGIFPDIELTVEFDDENNEKMLNEDVEKMVMFSDIILNNWKNNIVELKTFIYGVEFFLLDPESKLPKLKTLSVFFDDYSNSEKDIDTNRIMIGSALIQNNADSLETLITNFDVEITKPLKLKKLGAVGRNSDSVFSLLHKTSKTLKSLVLGGTSEESQAMISCPELKLRELVFLSASGYPPPYGHDMISVLEGCKHSLKLLTFKGINIELKDELNSVQLVCLEELIYNKSNVADLPVMLKANSSTLKKLELSDVFLPEETMTFDDDLQLSLETFVVKSIPKNLATFLINASIKTLTVLHLGSVKDDLQDLILDKLQLKDLYLKKVHANTVAKLISALENLEKLKLENISCTNEIDNKLGKLKQLDCKNTCLHLTENLTKLANLSLTKLVVNSPRTCNCALYPKYELYNLIQFKCERGSSEYVSKILNSSEKTLKDVSISKLVGGKFNLEKPLSLRLLEAVDIETAIVKMVLMQQSSTLNKFVWKNGINPNQTIDPIFLRVLLQFRANNPHCLDEIKDEESNSESDEN